MLSSIVTTAKIQSTSSRIVRILQLHTRPPMANRPAIEKLFTCLDLTHLCGRFLSLGYDQLQDIIYLKKGCIDRLIDNPDDKAKFLRGLYEGNTVR